MKGPAGFCAEACFIPIGEDNDNIFPEHNFLID